MQNAPRPNPAQPHSLVLVAHLGIPVEQCRAPSRQTRPAEPDLTPEQRERIRAAIARRSLPAAVAAELLEAYA